MKLPGLLQRPVVNDCIHANQQKKRRSSVLLIIFVKRDVVESGGEVHFSEQRYPPWQLSSQPGVGDDGHLSPSEHLASRNQYKF